MKTSITKQFRFEAAHSLPQHTGKCKNLHGHSYLLEVTVSGPLQTSSAEEGMVMDFAHLSKIVEEEIISKWDHQYLNDLLPFTTTAEQLAQECFRKIESRDVPVTKVTLWETSKSYATVSKE